MKHTDASNPYSFSNRPGLARVWFGRFILGSVCFVSGAIASLTVAGYCGYLPVDVAARAVAKFSELTAAPQESQVPDDLFEVDETAESKADGTVANAEVSSATDVAEKQVVSSSNPKSKIRFKPESKVAEESATKQEVKADFSAATKNSSVPNATVSVSFDREQILNDYDNRISDEFSVPTGLRDRVGFWFDVYSTFDSNHRIIHHSRYPWIVYKVVDVSSIINSDTPKRRWMRNEKADKLVKAEAEKIRAAIKSVAHRKSMDKLSEYEQLVVDALAKLGGSVKKQASLAMGNTRVQVGQKDFFAEGLEISPRYLSGMEDIFRANKLPIELTRIPFVESSFNKHATSKVGATGIWQFMGNTGRKFMVVNDHIDERRSPFKASEAAARLLKENHMILHRSWPLAITAWNHGPPGIRKAMQAAGSRDLATIISRFRSKSFDFASSNFYSEFLAALHTQMYNKEIFGEIPREKSWTIHEVKLSKSLGVKEVIRKTRLSADDFLQFNPDLKKAVERNVALPAGFRLMLTDAAKSGLDRIILTSAEVGKKASASPAKKPRQVVSSKVVTTSQVDVDSIQDSIEDVPLIESND